MKTSLHFSSKSCDWSTPQDFFNSMNEKYGPLELDVCASPLNHKCETFFTEADDALSRTWFHRCWMNPPYGRNIGLWIKKAYEESLKGSLVVCLLPARTDTRWFHDYCTKGKIEFIRGRLKFGGSKNSAPFPSMVVVFGEILHGSGVEQWADCALTSAKCAVK
jgi:phage N-6-adenine-methyltransferase